MVTLVVERTFAEPLTEDALAAVQDSVLAALELAEQRSGLSHSLASIDGRLGWIGAQQL